MTAVIELRRVANLFEAAGVDPPVDFAELLGQRQHQGEDVLGDRAVDPPSERFDRNAAGRAGFDVDVAEVGSELLHDLEVGRAIELGRAEFHAFHDRSRGVGKGCPKGFRIVGHAELGREDRRNPGTQFVPPGVEIRQVDRKIVGDRVLPVGRRVRVEDDLDVTDDRIVLGDDDRHDGLLARVYAVAAEAPAMRPNTEPEVSPLPPG